MKITRCLYRQEQKSLLSDERTEVRGLFEVEHNDKTGLLLHDADYDRRGVDVECYCDVPDVTTDTLADSGIDEEVWNCEPEHKIPTPEITAHIDRLIHHRIK